MDGAKLPVPSDARIGPNAILQTIGILDRYEGRVARDMVMGMAGVAPPPADSGMLPEVDCAAVHRAVRFALPRHADGLLRLSGVATGDYILKHRIPRFAQVIIQWLPAPIGARILAKAITRHAWTFAGSGSFRVLHWVPLRFEVRHNPLILGEVSEKPLCHWHAAVFERLFARLVWPSCVVTEISCEACGDAACVFELQPSGLESVR